MEDKMIHEDQKYIAGLVENNTTIIRAIYETYAPKVINYIKKNSGDKIAAQDIIQEVLIIIYHQGKNKNLKLTCPFDAYFFLLCKRRWLNELKKNSLQQVTINEDVVSINDNTLSLADETLLFNERQNLYNKMFQKLGDTCKELLKTAFKLKSMEEVASALGITYAYARKKKSLCTGKLTKLVQESPDYKNLQNLL